MIGEPFWENGMLFKTDPMLCRDCQVCTLACSLYHAGQCSPELARVRIKKFMAQYEFEIRICRHCADPACIAACPSEALAFDARGAVILSQTECLQCGACETACTYHAIFYNPQLGQYLKCDLCSGRPEGPACAELCPARAIVWNSLIAVEA